MGAELCVKGKAADISEATSILQSHDLLQTTSMPSFSVIPLKMPEVEANGISLNGGKSKGF